MESKIALTACHSALHGIPASRHPRKPEVSRRA